MYQDATQSKYRAAGGATLDIGVEAELNKSIGLFDVLAYGEGMGGSDSEQRQANLGVRIRW